MRFTRGDVRDHIASLQVNGTPPPASSVAGVSKGPILLQKSKIERP
ncbi:hypothetical protein ABIB80_004161 [Bradyrhizobium sp. i1.15.2]